MHYSGVSCRWMMEWFKKLAGDKTIQHDKYLKDAENTKYDYSDYNVEGIDSSHEFHPLQPS